MKYAHEFRERFSQRRVFTARDVAIYFGGKKLSSQYRSVFLHNLEKKGEIRRIKRGVYTFSFEIACVGFAYSPFYYGLQDALSVHNLWEQEANPIVITPTKARQGLHLFDGNNYIVRRISRKIFFGFSQMKQGGQFVPVSDVEKTLIDFFYFREPLSKEVVLEMRRRIKGKILEKYLRKCPKRLREIVRNALK